MKDALVYFNAITVKIPIETKQMTYIFPASQIIAVEAQGRKVIVHTTSSEFCFCSEYELLGRTASQKLFFPDTPQLHR